MIASWSKWYVRKTPKIRRKFIGCEDTAPSVAIGTNGVRYWCDVYSVHFYQIKYRETYLSRCAINVDRDLRRFSDALQRRGTINSSRNVCSSRRSNICNPNHFQSTRENLLYHPPPVPLSRISTEYMQTRLQSRVRAPPPPPPRREGTSPKRHDTQDDDFVHERSVATSPAAHDNASPQEWSLRVRIPPGNPSSHSLILSIHITPEMTAATLAACLQQAIGLNEQPIVGLFQESRMGHFYTLEHVLKTQERDVIYTVQLTPPPPLPPKPTPWYLQQHVWILAGCPLLLYWSMRYFSNVLYFLEYSTIWLYKAVVQIPLLELYRYGPWIVGWEGASLPQICSRITYHGDEMFWERNLEECQRIFSQKEEAWLKVARPLWWIVLLGLLLLSVQWLVASFRSPTSPPVDREMVETYRAWQILLQQASKHFHQQRTVPRSTGKT